MELSKTNCNEPFVIGYATPDSSEQKDGGVEKVAFKTDVSKKPSVSLFTAVNTPRQSKGTATFATPRSSRTMPERERSMRSTFAKVKGQASGDLSPASTRQSARGTESAKLNKPEEHSVKVVLDLVDDPLVSSSSQEELPLCNGDDTFKRANLAMPCLLDTADAEVEARDTVLYMQQLSGIFEGNTGTYECLRPISLASYFYFLCSLFSYTFKSIYAKFRCPPFLW